MGSFCFSKKERLLNRKDFVNLNRIGKRFHSAHFLLYIGKNRLGITRLGIIASKKIGNAVTRNRVKRFIREFFRLHKSLMPEGIDILVVARTGAGELDYHRVKEELGEILLDKGFKIKV